MKGLRVSLVLVALLCSFCAGAEDRLEPCRRDTGFLQDYFDRVENISRNSMPSHADFWTTVVPSFFPEWGVGVSINGDQYFVTYVSFDQSLWEKGWKTSGRSMKFDISKAHVGTTISTSRISRDLYQAFQSEWATSIANAQPSDHRGKDGVTYYFEQAGQCAETWSPSPETRNGKLVDLVNSLRDLAKQKSSLPSTELEQPLLTKLHELTRP